MAPRRSSRIARLTGTALVVAGAVMASGAPGVYRSGGPGAAVSSGLWAPVSLTIAVAAPPVARIVAAPVATEVLARLAVKGRAPATGYARNAFGDGWADSDHDGCSTREEILQRDLTQKTFRVSSRCRVVATGMLADPYSGKPRPFRRGNTTSGLVQIDHVVALGDSWRTGAQRLTAARRVAFANDPMNLLAVDGALNQQKGAADAASWLPPNKAFRCRYVARQVAVKATYGLWVTPAEKVAIARILGSCPGQRIPTR